MKLFFRKYGEGPPLLILHGLFGQSDNWTSIARQLGQYSFSAITIDLRNHGLSPHADEFSYMAMARDLLNLIREEKWHKPVIVGHSMGAKVALWFNHLFPDMASAVIPVDMGLRKYPAHHHSVIHALNSVNLKQIRSRQEADQAMAQYIRDVPVRQFLLKNLYRPDIHNEKWEWRFNLKIISENYENILEPVPGNNSSTPVFLLYGENSSYITPQDLEHYHQYFADFHSAMIPRAGHWVHADQPVAFLQQVLKYLKDHYEKHHP